ncbi:MAG: hypothetical protein JWM11_2366 [Planctomycetaceae bacterium]|nr:hypothetical protein [Planctomycetaceae bacterium]
MMSWTSFDMSYILLAAKDFVAYAVYRHPLRESSGLGLVHVFKAVRPDIRAI